MDAYDGGSNARRQPGAPSEPDDAPEPQRLEGADGADGAKRTQAPGEPAPPSQPGAQSHAPDREPADVPPAAPDPYAEPTDTRPSDPAAIREAAALAPAEAAAAPAPYGAPHPPTGVAALSLRYQIGVALALAVVAVAVCVHIGMVFLHVAPQNTVTKQHGRAVDDWVYPEFEQNWKLFAPNPLQLNIAVQVRARISSADGGSRTTGWYDLSAQDGRAIDGNLLPSHTQQNELRRSWDLFVATHDADNRPVGLRGALSETYLRRIVVLRLERDDATARGDVLVSVQVRSRTTNVPPPKWSEEKVSVQPVYRELPWWAVTADDAEGSAR
ncbi:DUF5819 family protein [Streptomyces canus]|uniref:DUF5819 family protein n=1 Tax=Streptomyces canus TaxID=58343 RepID=UPI002E353FEB|nr:DUF5819 family protein [Streptomyces canus]